jgi:hypothetical protein
MEQLKLVGHDRSGGADETRGGRGRSHSDKQAISGKKRTFPFPCLTDSRINMRGEIRPAVVVWLCLGQDSG